MTENTIEPELMKCVRGARTMLESVLKRTGHNNRDTRTIQGLIVDLRYIEKENRRD